MSTLRPLLLAALDARAPFLADLQGTDCYRVFHGAVEGRPGLTVDRYGPVLLAQTFRAPLEPEDRHALNALAADLPGVGHMVWNHRGEGERALSGPSERHVVTEDGLRFAFQSRHRGLDPWLFLDFRAGRRRVRQETRGRRVLNLFAYTCTMGVAAAAGGARHALNIDFSESALAIGRENAALNDVPANRFTADKADVIPTIRQLAGLPVKGRGRRRPFRRYSTQPQGIIVLDPPTWARSPFGAVDPVRDYASLFKPCLLAAAPGGAILATNHVSTVDRDDWVAGLRRCADKAGRPLADVEIIPPDADFPSPDGHPPLKMAWCTVR